MAKDSSPTALVPGVTSVDREIPGAAGNLPARVYTPAGKGPFPVVVYFHGGGWVIADKKVYDGGARGIAKAANAIVVSVDYRQAPENKFPAAWDD
ncbi:MAG: alpha/beta hydrolase, partial [Nostoc sp.]